MLNRGPEVFVMTNGMVNGRARLAVALTAFATLCAPAAASAQIRQVGSASSGSKQTINFTIGYFALKGLDSRVNDDVLLNELQSAQPLLFEVKDFNSAIVGGEYLVGVSSNFEAGIGVGFSQRTVPSVYAKLTHADTTEIEQDLKLRQIPVTFTGRFLLAPRGSAVEPYIGAGVVAIRYRYSETGEFVADDRSIFPARYIAQGTAVGPTVLAGVRAPVGNMAIGGEVRWQKAQATKLLDQGFIGDKFDLGGWTGNFTFGVRF
jgi:opacity protein-like surface antigen